MAQVILKDVDKVYEGNVKVVDRFNLEIKDGEFIVLVGRSGCGKSTTLRMIAGLEDITSGTIQIGERVVIDVPPKDRDIAMVFQSYALYRHMTVYENMAFALKLRKLGRKEIDERVQRAAAILGIQDLLRRKPRALRRCCCRRVGCAVARPARWRARASDQHAPRRDRRPRRQPWSRPRTAQPYSISIPNNRSAMGRRS